MLISKSLVIECEQRIKIVREQHNGIEIGIRNINIYKIRQWEVGV